MKKNVIIRIIGRQFADGESDETIVEAKGTLEVKEAFCGLEYDECIAENGGTVRNKIVFSKRGVKIEKRGALESDLFFVENKARAITYKTPYGVLSMESRCKKIHIQESGERYNIVIEYDLYASGELLSKNVTEIQIEAL